MPNIEILAYIPNVPMKDFIRFCVLGAPTAVGDPRPMPGVFKWLYSRRVLAAHFFTSDPKDNLQVFASTITQPPDEPQEVPWMDQIPGFDELVDGEVGNIKAAVQPPWQTTVKENTQLDNLFEQGRIHTENIFAALGDPGSGLNFTAAEFKAALRGARSTDLSRLLTQVEDKLDFSPFAELSELAG